MMLPLLPHNMIISVTIAVTATLSASSARNMWSTYNACLPTTTWDGWKQSPPPSSATEMIRRLQQCSRKESLEIFLHVARVPRAKEVEGAWDGVLLENNGILMTSVSQLLTHVLFSSGRRWNGKAFHCGEFNRGMNRFAINAKSTEIETDHMFDYQIEQSSLKKDQTSLVLRYVNYQKLRSGGWTSLLWKTMVDEIRIIDCSNGECVLIGMGSMGWSGGMYNGSPFCLYRPADTAKELAA